MGCRNNEWDGGKEAIVLIRVGRYTTLLRP